jgi:hypothetical protein
MTVCNIFAPSIDKFPAITKVGDILRCHRVKAQTYQVSHLRTYLHDTPYTWTLQALVL